MDFAKDYEFSTYISQNKKRLSEIVEQLKKERGIDMNNVDVTVWHQLIRDAEKVLFVERRII